MCSSDLREFIPTGLEVITVKDLLNLTNKGFTEKYQGVSYAFRGKNTLLRNALLVSANNPDTSCFEEILDDVFKADYLKQAVSYYKERENK